jgi:FMN phosphatase YigB (HAD superfamily)
MPLSELRLGTVTWSGSLGSAVHRLCLRAVAFDLRDTLVRPWRDGKVTRALTAAGVPEPLARLADEAASAALRSRLAGVVDVVDWKLAEMYEGVAALQRHGHGIDGPTFERAFRHVCEEYPRTSAPVVADARLREACAAIAAEDCTVAVVTDGVFYREDELLRTVFPLSRELLTLVTSSLVRANKFEARFYLRLAELLAIDPGSVLVVGNRFDKDVVPARDAGCHTCLLAADPPAGYTGFWAPGAPDVLNDVRSR